MKKNILRLCLLLIIYFMALQNGNIFAYNVHPDSVSPYGGHEEITDFSIDQLNFDQRLKIELDLNRAVIKAGNTNEDSDVLPLTHFYGGLYGIFQSATSRSKRLYDDAVNAYRMRDTLAAWDNLGHALHLLQDMSVPSHAMDASHKWHYRYKKGYEWWVTLNWNAYIRPQIEAIFSIPTEKAVSEMGSMWSLSGFLGLMTRSEGYAYDLDEWNGNGNPANDDNRSPRLIVGPVDAYYNSMILIPEAIKAGGSLFKGFWRDIGSGGSQIAICHTPGGGHMDENYDVSTRLLRLEELDPTKQLWKDLYGRTAIQKGYNELFISKKLTALYQTANLSSTDDDFNVNYEIFLQELNKLKLSSIHSFEDVYVGSPDLVLLSQGFPDDAANLFVKRLKEPVREVNETFNPVIRNFQSVFVIPSGGLYGFENSGNLKSSIEQYVSNGGTLIVFTQQHGYEFSILPTPDGKPITGYGWEEDQNCFTDGTYIDTWHQMLSGQNRSTPTVNVDGYFTSYPSNSTVLLRRTANGQPAMIMYDYGQGRVIATTMYSDWAYGHGQTSAEEIKLIRDMISWAKKPAILPEIKPGETASFTMSVINSSATPAASIRLQFYNPDRSSLLFEQSTALVLPPGETASIPVVYGAATNSSLGIHHVDYLLYDSQGNLIQPQAESDSGRFVISSPPRTGTINRSLWFSISTNSQSVFFGSPFEYTFHIFNNTDEARNLTIKTLLPHTNRTHEWSVAAEPNAETRISGSDLFIDSRWMFETLRAYLYDENGTEIGNYMLSFQGAYPSVTLTVLSDKAAYQKGDTVTLAVNMENKQTASFATTIKVRVTDPSNSSIYDSSVNVNIAAGAKTVQNLSFVLPASAEGGSYAILCEALEASGRKIGGSSAAFELPLSHVTVVPILPDYFTSASNFVIFHLANTGTIAVSTGHLAVQFTAPDGRQIASATLPFALERGQNTALSVNVAIPELAFGTYTLSYSQSDETRTGNTTTISIPNSVQTVLAFDRASYRVREEAQLSVTLSNTGKFRLDTMQVTANVPDAGYSNVQTVSADMPSFSQGGTGAVHYTVPLPAGLSAGQHMVNARLALSSGDSVIQSSQFMVPESSLDIQYDGPDSIRAGDTMMLTIENTGGQDTTYESDRFAIADNKGVIIFEGHVSGGILAGEKKMLTEVRIPEQSAAGPMFLNLEMTDTRTNKRVSLYRNLILEGVTAGLQAWTEKDAYMKPEAVTAIVTIENGDFPIENGTLKVTVKGKSLVPRTGLRVWFRADTGVAKDSSNRVSSWADQSGNGFTVSEASMYSMPLFVDNSLNRKPVIHFDGIDDYMLTPGKINLLNGTGAITTFVVVKPGPTQKQWADIYDYSHWTCGNVQLQQYLDNTNEYYINGGNTVKLTAGVFQIYGALFKNDVINTVYLNSFKQEVPPTACVTYAEPNYFSLGNKSENWQRQFNGDIAEVMIYNRILPEAERASVVEYLAGKYAINASLPGGTDVLYQESVAIDQSADSSGRYTLNIGSLNVTGKLHLTVELLNDLGQTIATAESPFYIVNGDIALTLAPDKKVYKPGDTITVSGQARNLGSTTASSISTQLTSSSQVLYDSTADIPAGNAFSFATTMIAGSAGTYLLSGTASQKGSTLAEAVDQYEVASPSVQATLAAPDSVGNEPFVVSLTLTNTGKTDASITMTPSFASAATVNVPAGRALLYQYSQQISASTTDTVTLSGDVIQTLAKFIEYGLGSSITLEPDPAYAEGKIGIPVTVMNTGSLDNQTGVLFQLRQDASLVSQQTRTYNLLHGTSVRDIILFDLAAGTYQVTASTVNPNASSAASFSVLRQIDVDMALSIGSQTNGVIASTVDVSNAGFESFDGMVRFTLSDPWGAAAWSAEQPLNQLATHTAQTLAFPINTSPLGPGTYSATAVLLDRGGRLMASRNDTVAIQGSVIEISQLPPSQTFLPGQDGTFLFKVKNTGNQEGQSRLVFRAYDILDTTRTVWLKPGEEQEVSFSFPLPADLDEKDYFAAYELQGAEHPEKGTVKYHLAGINLSVKAALDKQYYSTGDVAHLTLTVAQQIPSDSQDLFARVNYAGYEQKVSFSLNGTRTLSFDIPLSDITGEKLFYGIYHGGGRSIHLNAIYLYKAGDGITLISDKQVYDPGDTISVSILSNQPGLSGQLTLTGPGGFKEIFDYSGSASRGIALPAVMPAGTYPIHAELKTQNSVISASLPIDVNGIQVKITEAKIDKGRYAPADTIQLGLTISSNRQMPAVLRTWVVDPKGTYTAAGEQAISLTIPDPLLTELVSQVTTSISGIHRLVYGIYTNDTLLSSGSEAFDVGEAVLLGVSTDKRAYPTTTEQVTAKATLQGSGPVHLDFSIDGAVVRAEDAMVNGITTVSYELPGITPGSHTVQAVMKTGLLTSSLETNFSYGADLPDLVAALSSGNSLVNNDGTITVTAYVRNEGKAASLPTTIALLEGDEILDSKAVRALNRGEGETVTFAWIAIGKTGDHLLKSVVDPDRALEEFNTMNNTAITYVRIPDDTVPPVTSMALGKPSAVAGGVSFIAPETVIALSAADNYAGVARTEFRIDGGAWMLSVPFTIETEGSHTIEYYSLDNAGNGEAVNSAAVVVDSSAPSGSIVINNGALYTNSADVTLTLGCVDSLSGCSQMAISADGTIWPAFGPYTAHTSMPLSAGDGVKTVWVKYADALGHVSDAYSASIELDMTPPVTAAIPPDGLFNSARSISLTASEPATIYYTTDGTIPTTTSPVYVTPLSLKETTSVNFFAVDRAGNIETPVRQATYTFDMQPPVLVLSTLPDGSFTNNNTLNIAGTATDNLELAGVAINGESVIVSNEGSFSHAITLATGLNPVTTEAKDSADNVTKDVRTIILDQVVPAITISNPADNSVTSIPTIPLEGIVSKPSTVTVSLNGGAALPADMSGSAFAFLVPLTYGQNSITVTAVDQATNQASANRTIFFDNLGPSLAITNPAQDITTSLQTITLQGTVSDLTQVVVTIACDGMTYSPPVQSGTFEQALVLSAEKQYAIVVTAKDAAGNVTTATRNIIVDRAPAGIATLRYRGPQFVEHGKMTEVAASLQIAGTAVPLSGRSIAFTLGNQTCVGVTDEHGNAACAIDRVDTAVGETTVFASFLGDEACNATEVRANVVVFGFPDKGAFIIGDRHVAVGDQVLFWGSQWARNNSLTQGTPPSSFKGYADSVGSQTCGAAWTSRPGNSSAPPEQVPAYLAVLVSGNVSKKGSTISGNAVEVVIVRTSLGYGPDPGHPGTGQVIGVLCGEGDNKLWTSP